MPLVVADPAQAEEELVEALQTDLGEVQSDLALLHPHLDVSLPLWSHTAPLLRPHNSGIGHLLHCCRRVLSCSRFVHPCCGHCKKWIYGRHVCSHLTLHHDSCCCYDCPGYFQLQSACADRIHPGTSCWGYLSPSCCHDSASFHLQK